MPAGTRRTALQLAEHVRAAESDGQVILLDLRRSKYIGIAQAQSSALAGKVRGWPGTSRAETIHPLTVSHLEQRLLDQGLLVESSVRENGEPQIQPATSSVDAPAGIQCGAPGVRETCLFLASAGLTAWWLRFHSLHAIALKVAARRDRIQGGSTESLDGYLTAAASYEKLRPLVFSARDRCLHDSLAFVTFLAANGLSARWVVGVKTRPFGAHAWVQTGDTVLGDQHEYVRAFRPILVV